MLATGRRDRCRRAFVQAKSTMPDVRNGSNSDVSAFRDQVCFAPVSGRRETPGNYITKLPDAVHEAPEWQAAMEALILVATLGGPTMFARIGVMRAINRHVERVFGPSRKEKHWGRRKRARDQ